ncbi:TRAFAC clade GTPase domain-containing protein [Dyella sp.]|uniref:TRAFAC clade GTPase domain-containing protein n=1 Tax=Dyella sp. TaxID=1869338 RepID=UPI003F80987D
MNQIAEEIDSALHGGPGSLGRPVLGDPSRMSSFPSSRTLGIEVISDLMAKRCVTIVGILGDPESGKTACLASLYLMVSNAMLANWSFADSKSLMAFEDIARGARDWNEGHPPDQMTLHTEMADDRNPGFLHLRVRRKSDGRLIDFALPDLPGEWTKALIATARSDRWAFLRSAQALWVVVDGRSLADTEKRQGVISRLAQLAGRLTTLLDGRVPKTFVVVTHRDSAEPDDATSRRLVEEMGRRGVTVELLMIASFSDKDHVKAGAGIAELIDATVASNPPQVVFWPIKAPRPGSRSFEAFRRDE